MRVDVVLESLDAKKAFYYVCFEYIEKTQKKYGFGPKFLCGSHYFIYFDFREIYCPFHQFHFLSIKKRP